jgi:transcriptional regulator with XRE-family HTH domain
MTREQLARATGISEATLWRLESGRLWNPPVLYLTNCALALGVTLDDMLEPAHREWHTFDVSASQPTDPASAA